MKDANDVLRDGGDLVPRGKPIPLPSASPAAVIAGPKIDLDQEAPLLGSFIDDDLERLRDRRSGVERPVETPWPTLNTALGGGFWPGCYFLAGGTGTGKSLLALQTGRHAALNDTPVLYIGLELDRLSVTARFIGLETTTSWSDVYLGLIPTAFDTAPGLRELPIRVLQAPSFGWSYDRVLDLVAAVKRTDGKPPLVILDFLQLISSPEGAREDLRERIGRASYALRSVAREHDATILCISSVGRDSYGLLAGKKKSCVPGEASPAAFVGLGKESGEVEFAADGVLVMANAPTQEERPNRDVLIALAKLRARPTAWVRLRFSPAGFVEAPPDREDDFETSEFFDDESVY